MQLIVPGRLTDMHRRQSIDFMAVQLGRHLRGLDGELRFEPVTKRIRAELDRHPVCETTGAALVWEPRRVVPMYAIPPDDITAELVPCPSAPVPDQVPPLLGPVDFALHLADGQSYDVHVGDRVLEAVAFRPDDPDLAGRVVLEWAPFAWTEESQPVIGHPHDAFKRIDVLRSDRHVRVSSGGRNLAESRRTVALYETGLPTRWYLPRDDVDLGLLVPSTSTSVCAYKGHATYFSLRDGGAHGHDIAWTYVDPLHEVALIRDLVCFYSERTDLTVDGVDVPRPRTPWSSPATRRPSER